MTRKDWLYIGVFASFLIASTVIALSDGDLKVILGQLLCLFAILMVAWNGK